MESHHGLPEGVPTCHLFVYGTLRSGQPNAPRLGGAERLGRASVQGRLAHLGSYPGLVDGVGQVFGELYRLPSSALNRIDELEGFDPSDPDGSLFLRVVRPVLLEDQRSLDAWTYLWPGPSKDWIPHGDWIRFLEETRAGQPPLPWRR